MRLRKTTRFHQKCDSLTFAYNNQMKGAGEMVEVIKNEKSFEGVLTENKMKMYNKIVKLHAEWM